MLKLSDDQHILLINLHHIVFDGWSVQVLQQEIASIYAAFSNGQPSPLPELPIQYTDFAHWQRQQLDDAALQPHLRYWKSRLGGVLPILELPTDRARLPHSTFQGAQHTILLPKSLSYDLKGLSQESGATLFMTLLAAFQTLLYRYTGQTDIIVGTPIAGRDRLETESLIGVFINTLALRSNLAGNLTFRSLLSQVREIALDAYAHQSVTFEKLVEALQPERNLGQNPIFQTLFQLRNLPNQVSSAQSLQIQEVKLDSGIAVLDLALDVVESSEGLACHFLYKTRLFDHATISRMAGHFQVLLAGILANPEQPIVELPLLTQTEQHQLLVEWNDTRTDYPQDQCIHQRFEAQVERCPDAVAVMFEEQQLTYAELNHRANQVAHYLQSLGVGPEVFVGICVERSLEMVVSLLGILKAGGSYVSLDPAYPQDRLQYMIENSQLSVLLTQQKLRDTFAEQALRLVCIDSDWAVIAQQAGKENLDSGVVAENLAYVIYTSGSTGKPKGVMVQHDSLVNFTEAAVAEYGITGHDRVLQFASVSFDARLKRFIPA